MKKTSNSLNKIKKSPLRRSSPLSLYILKYEDSINWQNIKTKENQEYSEEDLQKEIKRHYDFFINKIKNFKPIIKKPNIEKFIKDLKWEEKIYFYDKIAESENSSLFIQNYIEQKYKIMLGYFLKDIEILAKNTQSLYALEALIARELYSYLNKKIVSFDYINLSIVSKEIERVAAYSTEFAKKNDTYQYEITDGKISQNIFKTYTNSWKTLNTRTINKKTHKSFTYCSKNKVPYSENDYTSITLDFPNAFLDPKIMSIDLFFSPIRDSMYFRDQKKWAVATNDITSEQSLLFQKSFSKATIEQIKEYGYGHLVHQYPFLEQAEKLPEKISSIEKKIKNDKFSLDINDIIYIYIYEHNQDTKIEIENIKKEINDNVIELGPHIFQLISENENALQNVISQSYFILKIFKEHGVKIIQDNPDAILFASRFEQDASLLREELTNLFEKELYSLYEKASVVLAELDRGDISSLNKLLSFFNYQEIYVNQYILDDINRFTPSRHLDRLPENRQDAEDLYFFIQSIVEAVIPEENMAKRFVLDSNISSATQKILTKIIGNLKIDIERKPLEASPYSDIIDNLHLSNDNELKEFGNNTQEIRKQYSLSWSDTISEEDLINFYSRRYLFNNSEHAI